jgi:hypothetical protein
MSAGTDCHHYLDVIKEWISNAHEGTREVRVPRRQVATIAPLLTEVQSLLRHAEEHVTEIQDLLRGVED